MLRGTAKVFDTAMMWLSRTLSMLVVMVGPALLGHFLDRRWGTGPWLVTVGVMAGMALFIFVLTIYTKRFGPQSGDPGVERQGGGRPVRRSRRRGRPQGKTANSGDAAGREVSMGCGDSEWGFSAKVAFVLVLATGGATAVTLVATFSHRWTELVEPAVIAWLATLGGLLPPLFVFPWVRFGPARPMLLTTWRMLVLLPTVWAAAWWEGDGRNCFLAVMMACYFIALPLESWLLIRRLRSATSGSDEAGV